MAEISNQAYLLTDQYKDSSNLNARIQLHQRFSTNKYDWHRWVFDQLKIASGSQILELGCGPAWLWRNNLDRIPADWHIMLSDFSAGMLQEAQRQLSTSQHPFSFAVIDAQAIPLADASLDVVIANHMLYHVPDRAKALSEIQRVLKPGGRFYAATGGEKHLQEAEELLGRVFSESLWNYNDGKKPFTLESGAEELAEWFSQVTLHLYEDGLIVTEVEPLMTYFLSTRAKSQLVDEKLQKLREIVEQEIAQHGSIYITKSTGLFEARKETH